MIYIGCGNPVEILWKNTPLFVEISNQPILSHQIRPDFHNPSTGFPQEVYLRYDIEI
jgi:hypothetical protein